MTIMDLKQSLYQLPHEEAIALILAVRARRRSGAEAKLTRTKASANRTAKAKKESVKGKTQKVELTKLLGSLSREEKLKLLQELQQ